MRASDVLSIIGRLALVAACGYSTWRAIAIARADWAASAGTIQGFEQALRIDPSDPDLVARAAIFRNEVDDSATLVDQELRRAAQLNPLNSALLMTLGLREEVRGEPAKAEADLVRAAEVDHQFRPAWTLANYYFRAGKPDKSWVMIRRTLQLDPLGYDPAPVFELAWQEASQTGENDTANAEKIAALVPSGALSVQYLAFLMRTHRAEATLAAWPRALAAAGQGDASTLNVLTSFPAFLAAADRVPRAVKAWNELAARGLIQSSHLDGAQGQSIADPDFRFGIRPNPQLFDWRVAEVPGVFATATPGSFDLEISGDEPPSFEILSINAPVEPATRYRLVWKADASSLNSPHDPGLAFQVALEPGQAAVACPPMLAAVPPACEFTAGPEARMTTVHLIYSRAQGTVRVSGTLHLLSVRLEIVR